MENFIAQIPTTPIGWFSTFIVILAGAIYLMSKIRKDDFETLRSSNLDLRASLNDMRIEMDEMKIKLTELESKNGTLNEVFSAALDRYFRDNPEVVKEYQKLLKGMYQHNKQTLYDRK